MSRDRPGGRCQIYTGDGLCRSFGNQRTLQDSGVVSGLAASVINRRWRVLGRDRLRRTMLHQTTLRQIMLVTTRRTRRCRNHRRKVLPCHRNRGQDSQQHYRQKP